MTIIIVLFAGIVVLIGLLAVAFLISVLVQAGKTGNRIQNTFRNIEKAATKAAQQQE